MDVTTPSVPERTIDEIKVEAKARAERGNYPMIGLDPDDVRDALARIKTRDPDEWASGWCEVADRYYQAGTSDLAAAEQRRDFLRAWRLYYLGQWPVAASLQKEGCLR